MYIYYSIEPGAIPEIYFLDIAIRSCISRSFIYKQSSKYLILNILSVSCRSQVPFSESHCLYFEFKCTAHFRWRLKFEGMISLCPHRVAQHYDASLFVSYSSKSIWPQSACDYLPSVALPVILLITVCKTLHLELCWHTSTAKLFFNIQDFIFIGIFLVLLFCLFLKYRNIIIFFFDYIKNSYICSLAQ